MDLNFAFRNNSWALALFNVEFVWARSGEGVGGGGINGSIVFCGCWDGLQWIREI